MSVCSTPALRVGVCRCPPGDPLWIVSGRTGAPLHRFDGREGDQSAFSVADVGDVNHDHVPDVYGADYNGPASGFAGVYSGRDGTLLHSWTGAAGDGLGPGRGAGDVDRDHTPDLAVGSYLNTVGAGDVNRDGRVDLLASGAEGDTVYMIAGDRRRR